LSNPTFTFTFTEIERQRKEYEQDEATKTVVTLKPLICVYGCVCARRIRLNKEVN